MPQQRWVRLIPVAFIMYTIAYIDRTNISLALPWLSRDLHMNPTQAGAAAGIFFWGYIALQIPGGYLASHWSAKRFVAILLVVWGLCAVGCGLVHTGREFWVMRLLLGVAEGGVWPATLVLLSHWFPRAERARANALWMLCLPAAVIFSSPLSGWILGRWNWRVLLIAEGALPFMWLAIWLWFIADHPRQARWISREEREHLETTLANERSELGQADREPYWRVLLRPQVLILVAIYFMLTSGNYGYLFWLPTALASFQKLSPQAVSILFMVPYVLTAIGMVLNARHSDLWGERRRHVALGLAVGGVFILASVLESGRSPVLSFAFLCIGGAGPYAGLGPFWAIPTETLPPRVAGSAMGLINAIGNLGGYFGPLVVGYLNTRTGNFVYAFSALSGGLLVGAAMTALLHHSRTTKQIPPP
ncbi:MAG: MFS transporter [Terriglobia bacterium]